MARITFGLGTSHGPQLMLQPDKWSMRVPADREAKHFFNGRPYTFEEMRELRRAENIDAKITPEAQRQHYDRCQAAREVLKHDYAAHKPQVAVIVGNDQWEIYTDLNIPAFSIYWGDTIRNVPKTREQLASIPSAAAAANDAYTTPVETAYPVHAGLGRHLIESVIRDEFDVSQSIQLSVGPTGSDSVPHAYGYIYRQVMDDDVIPHVPIMINTHNPPNRPTARRCFELGRALARAVQSWPEDIDVAFIASGGLTHFAINETFDREFLMAAKERRFDAITAIPETMFEAGTAELKNWIPVIGAMAETDLAMTIIDYVPCYRSEAGTGNAMAFATWS